MLMLSTIRTRRLYYSWIVLKVMSLMQKSRDIMAKSVLMRL